MACRKVFCFRSLRVGLGFSNFAFERGLRIRLFMVFRIERDSVRNRRSRFRSASIVVR